MDVKLKKIMEVLGLQPENENEVKLESMTLIDGGTIEAESFEAGKDIFIITEEEKIPLPAGDYETEEGKVIVVVEEGVISEVKDKEQPAEEQPAEEVEVEQSVEYVTKAEFDALVQKIENLSAQIQQPKEEIEFSDDKFNHSPENQTKEVQMFRIGQKAGETISDRIFEKLFKKG